MEGDLLVVMVLVFIDLLHKFMQEAEKLGLIAWPVLIETEQSFLEDMNESFDIVEILGLWLLAWIGVVEAHIKTNILSEL